MKPDPFTKQIHIKHRMVYKWWNSNRWNQIHL